MIVRLPRDLSSQAVFSLPEDAPEVFLRTYEDAAYLYGESGKLVGQILYEGGGATVSVGDAPSYRVQKHEGSGLSIVPFVPSEKTLSYETFGNLAKANYTLYEYHPGVVRPEVAARVTQEPLDPTFFYADLSERSNVFRTLLLVVALARIA